MSSASDGDDDPRAELGRLARSLAAATRRARAHGTRRAAVQKKRASPVEPPTGTAERPATSVLSAGAKEASVGKPAPSADVRAASMGAPAAAKGAPVGSKHAPPATQRAEVADDAQNGRYAVAYSNGSAPSAARATRAAAKPDPTSAPHANRIQENRARAAACSSLDELRTAVASCTACDLCKTRTQTVFMDGQGSQRILFIGEAPGAEEDRTGVPFVGRAGQLLTDIITKGMGLAREDVWIANVVKCRPPENREPTAEEKALCTPWLDRQIELMDPRIILPLGRHAAMHILGIEATMGAMRGATHLRGGRPIVPTFHPAYLLRSPGEKKECWKDIQRALEHLGLPVPRREPA